MTVGLYLFFSNRASINPSAPNDCGPQALVALLAEYRIRTSPESVALLAGTDAEGTTMIGLKRVVESHGITCDGMRLRADQLRAKLEEGHGVIAFVNGDHYVHVKNAHSLGFVVKDRDPGYRFVPMDEWGKIWFDDPDDAVTNGEGMCLVLAPPPFYRPRPKPYSPVKAPQSAS